MDSKLPFVLGALLVQLYFVLGVEQAPTESAKANALIARWYEGNNAGQSRREQERLDAATDGERLQKVVDEQAAELRKGFLQLQAELGDTINLDALDEQSRLSCKVFARLIERTLRSLPFQYADYPVNHRFTGVLFSPMAQLRNLRIEDEKGAQAWIERVRQSSRQLDLLVIGLRIRRQHGVVPPKWVFPPVAEAIRGVLAGVPFDDLDRDSPPWADFKAKVRALSGVNEAQKTALLDEGRAALRQVLRPAYERVLAYWQGLEKSAPDEGGLWRRPDGEAYYANRLADVTTTKLTADEIHAIGLKEVARVRGEMNALRTRVNFTGDLAEFFHFLQDDPRFFLPNTPEGRQTYLRKADSVVQDMKGRLDQVFLHPPQMPIVVKAYEEWQKGTFSTGGAGVDTSSGSPVGLIRVNLEDMRKMPTHQLDSFTYHEGVPGHLLEDFWKREPARTGMVRRVTLQNTAFREGWALYCERLPKEMGLYQDPYADAGRLGGELLRAARAVVDTGINARRWTRQQALDYFVANVPFPVGQLVREVERSVVAPAGEVGYLIGYLKILELREAAKSKLRERFDLREFHEVIMKNGELPLDILEEQVQAFVEKRQADASLTLSRTNNFLVIRGGFPGGEIRINYLEAYCRAGSTDADWQTHTVVSHKSELVSLSPDNKVMKLKDTVSDGVIVEHTITAKDDEVDFHLVARNPTDKRSEAHWAQPCVRLAKFMGFEHDSGGDLDDYLPKCFIFLDGKLERMPTRDWVKAARYTPGQVWCPANVPRTDVNPRPLSPLMPSNGLIGCFSADEKTIWATAWEPYQELFQGVARCLHADFRLGGLQPGETRQIRGKIYLVKNDVPALVKRYEKDFPEHVKAAKGN